MKNHRRIHSLLLAMIALGGIVRVGGVFLRETVPRPVWTNLLMQFGALGTYVRLLLLPLRQTVFHGARWIVRSNRSSQRTGHELRVLIQCSFRLACIFRLCVRHPTRALLSLARGS